MNHVDKIASELALVRTFLFVVSRQLHIQACMTLSPTYTVQSSIMARGRTPSSIMAEPSVTPGCLVKSAIAVVLLLAAVEGARAVVHKTIQVYALKDTPSVPKYMHRWTSTYYT
jgi:hypothetical protein